VTATRLEPPAATRARAARPYRIDFAQITIAGNRTRYLTTRPLVERDPDVAARWFPIRTSYPDDPLNALSFLPGHASMRLRHLVDGWRLFLKRPPDAAVLHLFDTYYQYVALRRLIGRDTLLVHNADGGIPGGRAHRFAVRHTDLFVPWSEWAARETLRVHPGIPPDRIVPLHPGLDLSRWPQRPPRPPSTPFRLLFVGGDLPRKGGDTLLDAFEAGLAGDCELDVATQREHLTPELEARLARLPDVRVHLDLRPHSPELTALYRQADCFVLPTRKDMSPWVALEALATGVPMIASAIGGIPEMLIDGETGLLIPPDDAAALVAAITRLRRDPALAARIAHQGRAHVEAHFDAVTNTQRLLDLLKDRIEHRRATASRRAVAAG
jgi:glycosyltransferase involved in cell wall biosynthesis